MPQPGPWPQSGLSDTQLLQQHVMLKQLQELQRQHQRQQLGDLRQQNFASHLSASRKQAAGSQFPNLINGTPVSDGSQMVMNWVQHGASSALQGVQGQAMVSMGQVPQQLDVSLYGTPIANARGGLSPYPPLHGMSNDHANSLIKAAGSGNQAQKPTMHSSAFNTTFLGDQRVASPDQVCMPNGASVSKLGFSGKTMFCQVPIQGFNSGNLVENFQQANTHHKNVSQQEFNRSQERAGWPGNLQDRVTQNSPSQSSVTLDPLEEKILFGMNDDSWDASFCGTELSMGSLGNELEHTDYSNPFPSIQSGSWSALMQSAVAEASSSDTGLQEEWSGLTFQNMELSADNQPSNFVDNVKQHAGCVDSNLQSASSLSSKSFGMFNDPNMTDGFHGFQPPGIQFLHEQKEGTSQESPNESFWRSPKNAGNWLDCNTKKTPSFEQSKQVQQLAHFENAWTGQNSEHLNRGVHQQTLTALPKSTTIKSDQQTSQQIPYNYHPEIMTSVGFTIKRMGNESMANDYNELSDGPLVMGKSYSGAGEAHEKPQNFYQSEKSNDSYNSIAFKHSFLGHDTRENLRFNARDSQPVALSHRESPQLGSQRLNNCEQGSFGQPNMIGSVYNNSMDLEKGHLPESQGNSKASDIVLSGGNSGSTVSTSFRSHGFHGPNSTAQKRENMPELQQKIDHIREDCSVTNMGSIQFKPTSEVSKAETPDTYVAQLYNQAFASQGFNLRLAPSCERVPNSNLLLSQGSPQTGSDLDTKCASQELGRKGQTWVNPASPVQSLLSSPRSSQREHWDGNFSSSGQAGGNTSHLHMHGTSSTAPRHVQMQHMSNAPAAFQSSQTTLPGTASRLPPFNLAPSQDNLRNPFGQQLPVLEAVPVTQPSILSGISQLGEVLIKPQHVWKNIPTQRFSSPAESHKVLPSDPSNNRLETTSFGSQDPVDRNSEHVGTRFSVLSASSTDEQGIDFGEEQPGKRRSQQQIISEIIDTSQTGNLLQGKQSVVNHIPDGSIMTSGSSVALLHPQDINGIWQGDDHSLATSMKNVEAFSHSLNPSHVSYQNYSVLQQMQAMRNVETGPSKRALTQYKGVDCNHDVHQLTAVTGQQLLYGQNSGIRSSMANDLNPTSLSQSGNTKILSFLSEPKENNSVKAHLRDNTALDMVKFGRLDIHGQLDNSNLASNRTESSQISQQMANSWFQQYGSLKDGPIQSLSDPKTANVATEQFSFGKPSYDVRARTSNGQLNAVASQIGSLWPSATASLVASELLRTPYLSSSDKADGGLAVTRPKKRKTATSELIPWHKEVTQSSQRLRNISMAEVEWAQAVNQLTEKDEDDAGLVEDGQPYLRPKKRLILTTKLMQQLMRPAPAAILSADAVSGFDSVVCFAAKLALGDACSLACCLRSDHRLPQENSGMMSEKLRTSERVGDQYFSKVMEEFTERTKRMEVDLLGLDKKLSMVDTRVDCQELEKFSIINRFAKFHIRGHGQADAIQTSSSSGTAAASPKLFPQRYVNALPMPRRLPEELQCLSL